MIQKMFSLIVCYLKKDLLATIVIVHREKSSDQFTPLFSIMFYEIFNRALRGVYNMCLVQDVKLTLSEKPKG